MPAGQGSGGLISFVDEGRDSPPLAHQCRANRGETPNDVCPLVCVQTGGLSYDDSGLSYLIPVVLGGVLG